jgi:hypothetical protein
MQCDLVGDSIKNISSMSSYRILLKQGGEFSIDFAREHFCAHGQFHCHNGRKVTDELDNLKLDRVPNPPYSPDLSRCDFCLFGMLKQKIKDWLFQAVEEIITAFHKGWDELILEDLQSDFFNCIERLE